MSEKNERPKPPTRRTGGRALGGAKKTTPPPPPAAELTPEQFAVEQTADQGEDCAAVGTPQAQPAKVPVQGPAQARTKMVPEVVQASAPPPVKIVPTGPVQELAVVAPEAGMEAVGEPKERHVPPAVAAPEPAAPAVKPLPSTEPISQTGPSPITSAAPGVASAAEVAIRPAAQPAAGGTAFPVRADVPGAHHEQDVRSPTAPSEGASWAHGPGRPKDIPETAVILNQRIITRESLDSSVPAALKLKKRIKRFALDNELDHLPIGDIVSVALDEWLTARGF
ncbi:MULTISPECIES: hypothetical protein [unclassified Streptomyces]|uniref:hypothetical protein n=1 Tax=unclassified Streptomyces TaxID=2593676 RepID=UPI00247570D3|nr:MULTISPECIES: hypothetical protein [unclassified Streptomyces]MDH6449544.1 hypothetical protein [Streptomyces sp. SAI-119]MDH6499874.1 hypothetical protein [Streptomyces sp. SAI-149]